MHSPRVPPFGGELRDLARFRHACKMVFRVNPFYTENQKTSLVAGWLCNDAAAWFRSQGDDYFPESWAMLLHDVVHGLDGGAHLELQEELNSRVLGKNESLITYRLDLYDLFNALDTPPVERTKRFIRGLPEAMATTVAAHQPLCWEDAFRIANSICSYTRRSKIEKSNSTKVEPNPLPPLLQPGPHSSGENSESNTNVDGLIKQMEKLTLVLQPQKRNPSKDLLTQQIEKLSQALTSSLTSSKKG